MSGINGRMFNRENYSNETLGTFAYLSVYFIDLFYNEVYDRAVRLHRECKINNITDGYKWALEVFLKKINENDMETYSEIVNSIYHTFIDHGHASLTYENCINRIVREFVPIDYFKICSFNDKTKILASVITTSVRTMINKIISKYLADVIDNHNNEENVSVWQEDFIEILIIQREKLYQDILDVETRTSETGIVETMKKEIKLLFSEKNKLKLENIELKKEIIQLKNIILSKHKELNELKIKLADIQDTTPIVLNNVPDEIGQRRIETDVQIDGGEVEFNDDDMFNI